DARRSGQRNAGAVPRLSATAGSPAPGPAPARQARPVRHGPAGATASVPGPRPVPRPQRSRVGRVATADPGELSQQCRARFRPGQTRRRPRALTGGGAGRLVGTAGSLAGGGAVVAQPASCTAGRSSPPGRRPGTAAGGPARRPDPAALARLVARRHRHPSRAQPRGRRRANQTRTQTAALASARGRVKPWPKKPEKRTRKRWPWQRGSPPLGITGENSFTRYAHAQPVRGKAPVVPEPVRERSAAAGVLLQPIKWKPNDSPQ